MTSSTPSLPCFVFLYTKRPRLARLLGECRRLAFEMWWVVRRWLARASDSNLQIDILCHRIRRLSHTNPTSNSSRSLGIEPRRHQIHTPLPREECRGSNRRRGTAGLRHVLMMIDAFYILSVQDSELSSVTAEEML